MAALKTKMFEEVGTERALGGLDPHPLGISHLRLLPKQSAMRPIMNLRRRARPCLWGGEGGNMKPCGDTKRLGPSINTTLGPVSSALKLEKVGVPRLHSQAVCPADVHSH